MADFLDTASDLARARKVSKIAEFERVFKSIGALQSVHSKAQLDLYNIESVFTVLELSKTIRRLPGVTAEDIGPTIAALKTVIVQTLEETMQFPLRNGSVLPHDTYLEFATLLKHLSNKVSPPQSVSVLTFNYDVGLDLAMSREGIGPDYCLGATVSRDAIPLHKLHGSLNWGVRKDGSQAREILDYPLSEVLRLQEYSGSFRALRIGSELPSLLRKRYSVDVFDEPLIVPPSWNKADYHQKLSDVWSSAARHLSEADRIFVLGYSLPSTDSFFRHLYALGSLGDSPLRSFEVFDPSPPGGDVDRRFREMLGPGAIARYAYHPLRFGEAVQRIRTRYF